MKRRTEEVNGSVGRVEGGGPGGGPGLEVGSAHLGSEWFAGRTAGRTSPATRNTNNCILRGRSHGKRNRGGVFSKLLSQHWKHQIFLILLCCLLNQLPTYMYDDLICESLWGLVILLPCGIEHTNCPVQSSAARKNAASMEFLGILRFSRRWTVKTGITTVCRKGMKLFLRIGLDQSNLFLCLIFCNSTIEDHKYMIEK